MGRGEPPPIESPGEGTARGRIIAAARRHFFAHGLRGVTMDDLAEELGMSKKTLYAHFPGKSALVEAVVHEKFRQLEAEVAAITSDRSDFLTGLHRLLACLQRQSEEVQPPFLRDLHREAPELLKWGEARRREVIQRHFGQLLDEGRRQGLLRKDVPVPLVIEVLLAAVQAILNPPKLAELGLTPKAALSAVLTVVLEGAINPKGRAER
jgi:AcrR family transcriptional regulator